MDKYIKGAVFFLFMLVSINPIKAYNSDDVFFFVVPEGYTMTKLSKMLSVETETLYKYNPELRDGLKIGIQIFLPATCVSEEKLKSVNPSYTLVEGTLSSMCTNDKDQTDSDQSDTQANATSHYTFRATNPLFQPWLYEKKRSIGFKPNPLLSLSTTSQEISVNISASELSEENPNCDNAKGDLRALVSRDDKFGFVNEHGKEVIPLMYDDATNFYNGFACVKKGSQHYLIDKDGNIVSDLTQAIPGGKEYNYRYNPLDGSIYLIISGAVFEDDPSQDLITWNTLGHFQKIHLELPHGAIWSPNTHLLSDDVRYFKNKKIVKALSSQKSKSDDEIATYSNAIYDLKGNLLFTTPENEDLQPFSCGLARIRTFQKRSASKQDTIYNIKYGFIDLKGRKLLDCSYDYAEDFSDSLACVHKNGKAGYIDTKGNVVIPFTFDGEKIWTVGKFYKENAHTHSVMERYDGKYKIGQFHNGLALQELNNNYVIIDKKGNIVNNLNEFKGHSMPVRCFDNGIIVFSEKPEKIDPSDNRAIDYVLEDRFCAYNIDDGFIVSPGKYSYIGPFVKILSNN